MKIREINMKTIKILSSIVAPAMLLVNTAVVSNFEFNQNSADSGRYLMEDTIESKKVDREEVLESFFDKYNSPLKGNSKTFVEVADKYDIDFRILPAISCIESSCGKNLPYQSNNPFGWGVYGSNVIRFQSYDEAINIVGKGLNENYFAKGLDTLEKIAPVYTPPRHVHWLGSVKYFVNEMDVAEKELQGAAISFNAGL